MIKRSSLFLSFPHFPSPYSTLSLSLSFTLSRLSDKGIFTLFCIVNDLCCLFSLLIHFSFLFTSLNPVVTLPRARRDQQRQQRAAGITHDHMIRPAAKLLLASLASFTVGEILECSYPSVPLRERTPLNDTFTCGSIAAGNGDSTLRVYGELPPLAAPSDYADTRSVVYSYGTASLNRRAVRVGLATSHEVCVCVCVCACVCAFVCASS